MATSFKDLRVWQDAMQLVFAVYKATASFPREELYGLTSQMRRAAVSIPSNIAEGKGLRTDREFCAYLYRARGSLMELQTQLMIARELQYVSGEQGTNLLDQCTVVGRSLAGLIHALEAPTATAGA